MIMSEDNKPGLLAGLLLGAGFTGVFMLPLILIRKLGVSAITLINTIGMTVFAGVQPYLHEWAFSAAAECSSATCTAQVLAILVGALPTWGWWVVAMMGWGLIMLRYTLNLMNCSVNE